MKRLLMALMVAALVCSCVGVPDEDEQERRVEATYAATGYPDVNAHVCLLIEVDCSTPGQVVVQCWDEYQIARRFIGMDTTGVCP